MAMVNVVIIAAYRRIYWLRLIGLVQRSAAAWRCVQHSSDEPGELRGTALLRWQHHEHCRGYYHYKVNNGLRSSCKTHRSTRKSSCAYFDCLSDSSHSLMTGDLQRQNLRKNDLNYLCMSRKSRHYICYVNLASSLHVTSQPGQLSLAIPLWVGATNTSGSCEVEHLTSPGHCCIKILLQVKCATYTSPID